MATEKRAEQASYAHGHHSSVVQSHARRTAQNSLAFVLPHLKPTDHILDLGCGPGSITVDLAALVPQGKVVGGDSVPAVLDQARELATQRGLSNITFEPTDGNALPFADGTFDVVVAHQVLQHVKSPVDVLVEMRRVTKPGGLVAARDADYRSFAWYPEPAELDRWGDIYQRVARSSGGEPNAARYLRQWAVDAGFERENVALSWTAWHYEGAEAETWGQSWSARTTQSEFGTKALAGGFAKQAELDAISAAWARWGGAPGAFFRIPNGEILCRKSR